MLTDIDAQLMKQHLADHQTQLAKLGFYSTIVTDSDLAKLIDRQTEMMHHHVKTMEGLLQNHPEDLPPLPLSWPQNTTRQKSDGAPLTDAQIAMDCRATAFAMGTDNYFSAHHMVWSQAKTIHFEMAQQNAGMASEYAKLAKDKGWATLPSLTPSHS